MEWGVEMTEKHTELPLKARFWDGEQWPERRVSIVDDNEHALFVSARYADIRTAMIQAEEISLYANYHHQLIEALRKSLKAKSMEDYSDAHALLAELDNLEQQK